MSEQLGIERRYDDRLVLLARGLGPAAQQPLQAAGMKERMRIGGRASATDHRQQLWQVALHLETTFPEIGHRATIVD